MCCPCFAQAKRQGAIIRLPLASSKRFREAPATASLKNLPALMASQIFAQKPTRWTHLFRFLLTEPACRQERDWSWSTLPRPLHLITPLLNCPGCTQPVPLLQKMLQQQRIFVSVTLLILILPLILKTCLAKAQRLVQDHRRVLHCGSGVPPQASLPPPDSTLAAHLRSELS